MPRVRSFATDDVVVAGRYRVIRCLGWGTQATVYLVEDLRGGEPRALKVAETVDDARRWRFVLEARILQRLSHPGLLRIHDVLNVAGAPAIVTELAEGGSVAAWLARNGPLPARLAVVVCLDVVAAVEHAHDRGVLHRDIKPGNLLVRADSSVALADFGTASCASATAPAGVERIVGTPAFMAPEQLAGGPVDERADVYGVGATLLRLCTGRPARQPAAWSLPPEPTAAVPAAIWSLVGDCCRPLPAHRIPTMRELHARLEAALDACPPVPSGTAALFDRSVLAGRPPQPGEDERLDRMRARSRAWAEDPDATEVSVSSAGATTPVSETGAQPPRAVRWPAAAALVLLLAAALISGVALLP